MQITKIFHSFLMCICALPLWSRFRHPCTHIDERTKNTRVDGAYTVPFERTQT